MIYKGQTIQYVAGIDPGLKGAISMYSLKYENKAYVTHCVSVIDMPTVKEANGKNAIRAREIAEYFDRFGFVYAFIEKVGAMPGQGVTSMFSFGRGVGALEATMQIKDIPYDYVSPIVWKKEFDLKGKPKEASLERAMALVSEYEIDLSKKVHTGRSDAMLIGLYGAQKVIRQIVSRDR